MASGERVSNTLATHLEDGDSPPKGGVITDSLARVNVARRFGIGLGLIS